MPQLILETDADPRKKPSRVKINSNIMKIGDPAEHPAEQPVRNIADETG